MTETKPGVDALAMAAPTAAEQIRSWLPDHAHVTHEPTGATIWSWTTSAGAWGITSAGSRYLLIVTGPPGSWSFGVPSDTVLAQTREMLLALGAIGGES